MLAHVRHPCQPKLYSLKTQTVSPLTHLNTALWFVHCFIFVHLDQTSCLVYACVLDFKLPLRKVIIRRLSIFLDTLFTPQKLGLWYPKDAKFDLIVYMNEDWAGDNVDRKSTSGAWEFLGRSLVSWSSKKQNCVALSTAQAEYIATASCATQLLWMRQTLKDYGITYRHVPLLCDNESAINIAENPKEHTRTKHIDIRYHFLRDHVEKGEIGRASCRERV